LSLVAEPVWKEAVATALHMVNRNLMLRYSQRKELKEESSHVSTTASNYGALIFAYILVLVRENITARFVSASR